MSKRPLEEDNPKEQGFFHDVSPIKVSRNNNSYFNACFQVKKNKFLKLVCFDTQKHATMMAASSAKTPVKLENVQIVPSKQTAENEILVNRRSSIQVVRSLDFKCQAPCVQSVETREATIEQIHESFGEFQKKANTLGRPKINRSGYSLYAEEYCNEHKGKPGYKAVPAMVAAAKSWNQLPADKKEKYTREANEIRHQGQERLSQWVQQMVLDGNYDVVRRSEVKQELINLGQPRKPQNAYNLFTLEFMKERNEEPMQQFQKKCSERWKKLPKDIKQLYKEDYLNKVELYKQAVENWESQMDEDDLLTFVKEAEKLLKTKSKFAPTKKSVSKELAKKATKSKRGRRKKVVVEDDKEMLKPKQVKEKKKAAKKEESNEWFEE